MRTCSNEQDKRANIQSEATGDWKGVANADGNAE